METFVVRVWTPGRDEAATADQPLRGVVEHVRSGQSSAFVGSAELLRFLEGRWDALEEPQGARGS